MRLVCTWALILLLASCTPGEPGAAMGDTVKVNYIGKFENGTVFDTSIKNIAEASNLPLRTSYEPLEVTIGQGKVIKGFENGLIGMNVGDKKEIILPPASAYGARNPGQAVSISLSEGANRTRRLQREVPVDAETFATLPGDNEIGEIVEVGDIEYRVASKDENGALLEIIVEEGDKVVLPGTFWNSTVVEIGEEFYYVRQDPPRGMMMNTMFGPAEVSTTADELVITLQLVEGGMLRTEQGVGRVTEVTEDKATIDFNHPLAGETLVFELERVE